MSALQVSRCELCPYGDGPACGSRGNPKAGLVIVGEAPGRNEVREGIPFVGDSGAMIEKVLQEEGLSLDQCFVTNALRCRAPEGEQLDPDAVVSCQYRLGEEISAHPRQLVIAMGNAATWSVTGNYKLKITQVRGQLHPYRSGEGTVFTMMHPAAILRSPGMYRQWADDLRYAVRVWRSPGVEVRLPGVTQYLVCNTPERWERAVRALANCSLLAADIETIDFYQQPDHPMKGVIALGVCWAKNRVLVFPLYNAPSDGIEQLRWLFSQQGIRWIWHNGKFDTKFLQDLNLAAVVNEDTMLMHYAVCEKPPHDLKSLAADYLGAPTYQDELRKFMKRKSDSFELLPRKPLQEYLAKDCDYTFQLYSKLKEELARDVRAEKLYRKLLLKASRFLQRVEARGMYVSPSAAEELRQELLSQQFEAERDLQAVAGEAYNPASPLQTKRVLYRQLRLRPLPRYTRDFSFDTREEHLLQLPPHPFVQRLLDYREVTKALGTYVDGILDRVELDGRVHTTYLIHGTETGRLSSRNPNVQNFPRKALYKRIIQAPSGRRLVEIDIKQAELRVLAALSRDPALIQVYVEGRDLHNEVALVLFGPQFTSEQRVRTKFLNFGVVYGRGPDSIVREFGIPFEEAQSYQRGWFRRYPVAHKYILWCREHPRQGKVLRSPTGRRRSWDYVDKRNMHSAQNEASNFPIQATASDITLMVGGVIDLPLIDLECGIINLVHDSLVIETPNDDRVVNEVIRLAFDAIQEVSRRLLGDVVPFEAEAKVGMVWGELHTWEPTKLLEVVG